VSGGPKDIEQPGNIQTEVQAGDEQQADDDVKGMTLKGATRENSKLRRELKAMHAEVEALRAIGDARAYATRGAIEWARSHPSDPLAAEALALAIDGWRWSACNDGPKSDLPRRAFALLHRQFPQSEWAMRTKYWYD